MNKHIVWIAAVAVSAVALSMNAVAQPPGGGQGRGPGGGMGMMGGMGGPGGGMMGGGIGMALQNPELAKILELTPEQTTQLQEIDRKFREERRQQMPGMRQGGGPPNPDQMRQTMEQSMDAIQAEIDQVLKPEQQKKSREVLFQLSGGLNAPMLNDRMLQVLELTNTQKDQLRKIMDARDEENRTAMQGGFDFRNATQEERNRFRADMEARNQKFAEQITGLLTPEQKATAEKLTAEAPALRERLGMPAQGGQRGQGRAGQQRGPGGPPPAEGYTPGRDSWQPGMPPPTQGQGGEQRRGNFPRPRQNNEQ